MMWTVIQKRLDEMNINQAELARRLNVPRIEVTKIKQGKKISLEFAFRLADVLGISVEMFRGDKNGV